jgi:photosystem II stability/assembly factor-like uncharacterized protein
MPPRLRHPAVSLLALLALLALLPAARGQGPRLPESYLRAFTARPLGPANMSGRVTSLAVVEKRPAVQYVGTAGGGVWKTTDHGATWAPLFDDQPVASVGAVAVAPSDPDVVWVGTGEANPRNSVSWGDGVYRSADGGKTWAHVGLRGTRHVGRIVVHPRDPATAYVAALGHLWRPGKERGVFKTTDGGRTWGHVLALDEDTGCVDLAMDPADPQTLYACAYRVRRDGFDGGNPAVQFGKRAGLYRTTDGGQTWSKLMRGLPARPLGRCGVSVSRKDPRVVYAVIQSDRTDIRDVPGQPPRAGHVAETGGVFRSTDRGRTWAKLNDLCPRPFYYGQVRVDPSDPQRVYVLGIPLYVSSDGGRTFRAAGARGLHGDHHDLWVNPANPAHLVLGNDGGVYYSTDSGAHWSHVRSLPVGQFYGVAVDRRRPYCVYGGLQDNGTWAGPSRTDSPEGITLDDWKRILPGDGFRCACDPDDADTLYGEAQWGALARVDLRTGQFVRIRPRPPPRHPGFRFNWNAPLLLSAHRPRALYFGGNHLFRSTDRGNSWQVISPDLTHGRPGPSADAGHTISALAESPLAPGVLWAGTDDGRLHVSRNGGRTWADVGARVSGVPARRCVRHVECSPFAVGTAYLALDRHRQGDDAPYLFRTEDFGATWKPLGGGLPPEGPVLVVRADPLNRQLLFAGTEFGLFVSLDRGSTWQRFGRGLPPAAVHDLAIHPRDRELVVATHGRGLFVVDVAPLQEMTPRVLSSPLHLFNVRNASLPRRRPTPPRPARGYSAPNPPGGAVIHYALRGRPSGPVRLAVLGPGGRLVAELPAGSEPGLHSAVWDLRSAGRQGRPARVAPGEYTVRLSVGEQVALRKLRVRAEP